MPSKSSAAAIGEVRPCYVEFGNSDPGDIRRQRSSDFIDLRSESHDSISTSQLLLTWPVVVSIRRICPGSTANCFVNSLMTSAVPRAASVRVDDFKIRRYRIERSGFAPAPLHGCVSRDHRAVIQGHFNALFFGPFLTPMGLSRLENLRKPLRIELSRYRSAQRFGSRCAERTSFAGADVSVIKCWKSFNAFLPNTGFAVPA